MKRKGKEAGVVTSVRIEPSKKKMLIKIYESLTNAIDTFIKEVEERQKKKK